MVDTTAFNEIIKAYCRRALREASVDKNIEEDVLTQLKLLFDEMRAKEVCSNKQRE